MSIRFQLQLPQPILDAMIDQARAELPNECCGLLAARIEAQPSAIVRVECRYPLVNAAASPVLYESEPKSMFAAVRDMRQRGLEIVAAYHSHPTSPPIPSRTDRERNYSEDVVNFIISLAGPKADVRAWWLTATEFEEAEWEAVDDKSLEGREPQDPLCL